MNSNTIHFTKMHGIGNDYIFVDVTQHRLDDPAALARQWCHRHTGIGADGLVLIDKASNPLADFSMHIFNADGSEGLMCGNALRCVGKLVHDRQLSDKETIVIETLSGIRVLQLSLGSSPDTHHPSSPDTHHPSSPNTHHPSPVESVTVDMMQPVFDDDEQFLVITQEPQEVDLEALTYSIRGIFVSMGNPHFVVFTKDVKKYDVERIGSIFEHHPAFPERCNIEFAQVVEDGRLSFGTEIRVKVWERGSGLTMGCGSGACAVGVAAAITGRAGRQSTIVMDGGTLLTEWARANDHVYLTGPAVTVFEGDINV